MSVLESSKFSIPNTRTFLTPLRIAILALLLVKILVPVAMIFGAALAFIGLHRLAHFCMWAMIVLSRTPVLALVVALFVAPPASEANPTKTTSSRRSLAIGLVIVSILFAFSMSIPYVVPLGAF